MEPIIFWIAAGISIVSSILVVTRKNPIYSALFMITAFSSFALLFALLSAPFIAAMHLMVYSGAIMVLFLFVIMLLNLRPEEYGKELGVGTKNCIALLSLAFFVLFGALIGGIAFSPAKDLPNSDFGSTAFIGKVMFGSYVLPFELLSLLIIVAIIWAVLLAKKAEKKESKPHAH